MWPKKRKFWLPLTRLSAFLVTFIIAENAVFQVLQPPAASVPQDPEATFDLYPRVKKRLDRRFSGAFQWLDDAFPWLTSASEDRPSPGSSCPDLTQATEPEDGGIPPPVPARASLSTLDFMAETFSWPEPRILPVRPEPPGPKAMGVIEWPEFRARLVTDLYRQCDSDLLADVGDSLLAGPELLVDGFLSCINGLSVRSFLRTSEEEEQRSVTSRMLDVQMESRKQRIFSVFVQQWAESEKKYLAAFQDSRVNTFGFQIGTEEADLNELVLDQRKVFWDTLRRTYLARYKVHSEEQIRDGAWYIDRWSGVDFLVLPPFIAGYLYYRGLDRKIPMGGMALQISFEPLSELLPHKRDRYGAAALEWSVNEIPVGIIVSAGLYNGRYEMDFVGIGTSIGAARGAVQGQHQQRIQ